MSSPHRNLWINLFVLICVYLCSSVDLSSALSLLSENQTRIDTGTKQPDNGGASQALSNESMITRRALNLLVTIGCLLPIALVIVLGVARLLATMQDASGATVLERIALGLGIVWGIDLVVLLLALGIKALETHSEREE